jgi:type IV fimbrial biogenesis protein FimT
VKDSRGFTLIEMMLVVTILGIVLSMAVPSLSSYMDRRRVIAAAEALYGEFQYARSEAIARSQDVFVSFSTDGSDTWSVGVSTTGGCDPTETVVTAANACVMVIDDGDGNVHGTDPDGDGTDVTDNDDLVLRVMRSTNHPRIEMGNTAMGAVTFGGGVTQARFDSTRGVVAGNGGTVALKLGDDHELRVILGQIGRVRICSPNGVGYSQCPIVP